MSNDQQKNEQQNTGGNDRLQGSAPTPEQQKTLTDAKPRFAKPKRQLPAGVKSLEDFTKEVNEENQYEFQNGNTAACIANQVRLKDYAQRYGEIENPEGLQDSNGKLEVVTKEELQKRNETYTDAGAKGIK